MKKSILLVHDDGRSRQLKPGFCWLGFLLLGLWALSEGLWRLWACSLLPFVVIQLTGNVSEYYGRRVWILIGLLGYLLVMIVFGIFGKKWLVADLLKHGYVEKELSDEGSREQFVESANTSLGISMLLLIGGAGMAILEEMRIVGFILLFSSLFTFIWGCGQYAKGKGYSPWFGGFGLLGFVGFIVLSWFPDKQKNE